MPELFHGDIYPLHARLESILPHLCLGTPEHKTMLDEYRLRILYELAIAASWLPGEVAEAGVWRGGVTYMLASIFAGHKTVHAFDSWEGLPGLTEEDCTDALDRCDIGFHKGWGKCDPPTEYLSHFTNVVLHKGWFADTFPMADVEEFCFVHVDCDLYQPIKECLEFFYPRLVPGGYMGIDDYLEPEKWPGAVKAVDDYFTTHSCSYKFYRWGGIYLRKLP